MTSRVGVPPLTGLFQFFLSTLRVNRKPMKNYNPKRYPEFDVLGLNLTQKMQNHIFCFFLVNLYTAVDDYMRLGGVCQL